MPRRVAYRKLPGRRRGFLRGASVWLGPDHLLLVRSLRFREEYKRYGFRDIQAIVVAKAPRFHLSTRAFAIALLWGIAFASARLASANPARPDWTAMLWIVAAGLVAAWLIVSAAFSCRCRIYTAVSGDEVPSLYRTWTARRFLARVEPLIRQAQGGLEGEWVREVEQRHLGPAASTAPGPARNAPEPVPARVRDLASDILVASLFTDALCNATAFHSAARWLQLANSGITLVEAAGAIAVIVQHYRGLLRGSMQKLAIATLAVMGIFYYARPIVVGVLIGATAAASKSPIAAALPIDPRMRAVDAILAGLLGVAGLGIMLFSGAEPEAPRVITPSS